MMTSTRIRILAVFAIAICGASIWHSQSTADEDRATERHTKLVEAARATLERTQESYDTGNANLEDVYRWSRRLMKAELKANPASPSAVEEHASRMRKLHERVAQQSKFGLVGGNAMALHAAEYYVAEAESN